MGKIYLEIKNLKRTAKALFTMLAVAFFATNAFAGVVTLAFDANGEKVQFQDNSAELHFYQLGSQVTLPAPLSGTTWDDVRTSATLSGGAKTTSSYLLKTAGTNN